MYLITCNKRHELSKAEAMKSVGNNACSSAVVTCASTSTYYFIIINMDGDAVHSIIMRKWDKMAHRVYLTNIVAH